MRLIIGISLLAGVVPVTALADLEYVKQTIYGMDCAPCAYGVEQGLGDLSGVEAVTVSLNDGYAEVHLDDDSGVTLADIREIIRKNGFSPKGAHVRVTGTLVEADDRQVLLQTDTGTFELDIGSQTLLSQLSDADSPVTLSGFVAAGDGGRLSVTAIE